MTTCPTITIYVTHASTVFTFFRTNNLALWTVTAMSAYLDEQTPRLRHLHAQLALPAAALQHDLHRIEAAIKAVITSIVREREAQVDQLKDDIAAATSDLATLARAVGDRRERRNDADDEETLPRQLERLNEQAVELKQVCAFSPDVWAKLIKMGGKKVYDERLSHIKQQQSTLDRLSTLLGPPWQPSKPLEVIASSSRSRGARAHSAGPSQAPTQPQGQLSNGMGMAHADGKRSSSSTQTIAQAIALGHGHSQGPTQAHGHDKGEGQWYDVRESVVEEIDDAVKLALAERVRFIFYIFIVVTHPAVTCRMPAAARFANHSSPSHGSIRNSLSPRSPPLPHTISLPTSYRPTRKKNNRVFTLRTNVFCILSSPSTRSLLWTMAMRNGQ